jgi:hypothetical protein
MIQHRLTDRPTSRSTAVASPQSPNLATPFALPKPQIPTRQAIASIVIDPVASATATLLGSALARSGWQVDLFAPIEGARRDQPHGPGIEPIAPYCRTVRFPVDAARDGLPGPEQLAGFAQALAEFYNQGNYPLIHTQDWRAGWVALQLKSSIDFQWIHKVTATDASQARADIAQHIFAQADCFVVPDAFDRAALAAKVAGRPIAIVPDRPADWDAIAQQVGNLYRSALAASLMHRPTVVLPAPIARPRSIARSRSAAFAS